MVGIQWPPEHITAFYPVVLTHLLGSRLSVMAGRAHGHETIERREWIATGSNRHAMINRARCFDPALLKA